jgi:hypothetical protein
MGLIILLPGFFILALVLKSPIDFLKKRIDYCVFEVSFELYIAPN